MIDTFEDKREKYIKSKREYELAISEHILSHFCVRPGDKIGYEGKTGRVILEQNCVNPEEYEPSKSRPLRYLPFKPDGSLSGKMRLVHNKNGMKKLNPGN